MRPVCGGSAPGGRRWRGSLELEGAWDAMRCRLLRAAWAVAGLVALLAVLVAVDAHADRRRQWTTYGSARGRLVVACDMRSDTCSDGRQITTTRATPVPCETSPGVWEMVPENTGCYSVRGLESWAANTSYIGYGAELDRWTAAGDLLVARTPDGQGWRLTASTDNNNARLTRSVVDAVAGEPRALACKAREGTTTAMTLLRDSNLGRNAIPLGPAWALVENSGMSPAGGSAVLLAPHPRGVAGLSVDVQACWLAKATTPGRPCWGGEAPVTCEVDRHTISTEGWPTESGEVCITATITRGTGTSPAVLIDGREASGDTGTVAYWTGSNTVLRAGSTQMTVAGSSPPRRLCLGRAEGQIYLKVDGVMHKGPAAPSMPWQPTARLGHGRVAFQAINGSISSLTVRSFE